MPRCSRGSHSIPGTRSSLPHGVCCSIMPRKNADSFDKETVALMAKHAAENPPATFGGSAAFSQLVSAGIIPAVMLFIFASPIINATESRTLAWAELGAGYALAVAALLSAMPAASGVAFETIATKYRILHKDDKGYNDACAAAANSVTWRFALTYLLVAYISSMSVFPSFGLPSSYCHTLGAVLASAIAFLFKNVIARTAA